MMPTINTPSVPSPAASAPANAAGSLANKSTFLQLLVAQIKNQDPTQPQDGVQFVSQLAQFSQLEQSIATNTTLGTMNTALGSANTELGSIQGLLGNTTTAPSATSTSTSNSGTTGSGK
jgi:flagellar basal-body rod modification protein FlgD